jgi:hypothetical protein
MSHEVKNKTDPCHWSRNRNGNFGFVRRDAFPNEEHPEQYDDGRYEK